MRPCPECTGTDIYLGIITDQECGLQCSLCGFTVLRRLSPDGLSETKRHMMLEAWALRDFRGFETLVMETPQGYNPVGGCLVRYRETLPMIKNDKDKYRFWKRKGIVAELKLVGPGDLSCWQYIDGSYSRPSSETLPQKGLLDRVRDRFTNWLSGEKS